jgi:proteasome lid subunit RPN8/RPN11
MSQPPRLEISPRLLAQIYAQGEQAYPEEGAGLLLGAVDGDRRQVLETHIPHLKNRINSIFGPENRAK